MRNSHLRLIIGSLLLLMGASVFAQEKKKKTILFVCEHGSAKSIVASAHFKKIAEQEGIHINIISRGTKPDEVVPEKINKLLNSDGFPSYKAKPVLLTKEDLQSADYVVTFNPIPASYGSISNLESWNIPSFEAGYPAARDSILLNIEQIIQRIKKDNQK